MAWWIMEWSGADDVIAAVAFEIRRFQMLRNPGK
jgi:hypothetical protein